MTCKIIPEMICNVSSGTLNPTMPCYSNKRGHCRVCWWISLCIVCCSLQMGQQFDQKNIRRRVYDALNVLMAMNIISKEKKEIRWIGLPTNTAQECQGLEVCTWLLGGLVSCCHCSTSAVTMLQTYFVYHRCLYCCIAQWKLAKWPYLYRIRQNFTLL